MSAPLASVVYQLRVVLRDVSPLIWRRLLVCSGSSIADLHHTLQIAFGWDDMHLHRFVIHGKAYGVAQPGGVRFADDPCRVRLADFAFRRSERFAYQYDFGDSWYHDLRVEHILPRDPTRIYPACVGGARAAPPEGCGGPWAYLDLRQHNHPVVVAERLAAILGAVLDADDPDAVIDDHRAEMGELVRWAATELDRDRLQPDTLGLTLAEAKALLQGVQQAVVTRQIAEAAKQHATCPACGRPLAQKGTHTIVVRSLFGTLRLRSPRRFHCPCQPQPTRTFSPLATVLPERTTPELLYLETKFASLMSYGLTARILEEVLPLGRPVRATTIRNHAQAVARRLDGETGEERPMFIDGCQRDWDTLPRPDLPLTVSLDGGYVHASQQTSRTEGWFEVIAGKSTPAEGSAKSFAFVRSYDTKPRRRLFDLLTAQGMQMNQQITFLTDGGETVRELPLYLNPLSEHWLDWFHITMRLTVMGQYAKSLPTAAAASAGVGGDLDMPLTQAEAERQLASMKWYLWHGNVHHALQEITDLARQSAAAIEAHPSAKELAKAVAEFQTYVENNAASIPNYGERYRNGEAISSAVAESTVNQVISRRMVKRQQMRWTPEGVHLLLQVRTRVLNDDLRPTFQRWYPALVPSDDRQRPAA